MRHTIAILSIIATMAGFPVPAGAQWPERAIKVVVPFPAAIAYDKIITDALAEKLGVPVYLEIVPGAGGTIALQRMMESPADGYTLGHGAGPNMILSLWKHPPYDPLNMTVIGPTTAFPPPVLFVRKSYKGSLKDFVEEARKTGSEISWGSGNRNTASMAGLQFLSLAGIKGATLVPSSPASGANQSLIEVLAGRYAFGVEAGSFVLPQTAEGGGLRVLTVLSNRRHWMFPDVPTPQEAGLQGNFELYVMNCFLSPKGTPPEIVLRLRQALYEVMSNADVEKRLRVIYNEPIVVPPEQMETRVRQWLTTETNNWNRIIEKNGLPLQ
ncbi:tripartite tricarboxylate transporter substrate binding protein [Candidatus Kaiserbacteria bacterium]|nr:tripartite tricarboxylate transporter substrate binding protein [Candidatus Kaiserbacteria bacterium]